MVKITRLNTNGLIVNITVVSEIADCLIQNVGFAKDEGSRLFYFDDGVYKYGGMEIISYLYKMLVVQQNQTRAWNQLMAKKVYDYIIADAAYILDRPLLDRINFRNGMYYIEDGKFELHTEVDHRNYYTVVQIPVEYNRDARGTYWYQFLSEIFPEDPNLLMDIVGLCLIPFTGLQKCVVLIGAGSNGKGTYLSAIQSVVGKENYTNLDIKRLTGIESRFNTACLVGKLVNVVGDVPPTAIENTGIFKQLTGEDDITIEYKNKQPFSYKPYARLIFSCNELMDTKDTSIGYKRRFFCIPFDKQFEVDPKKKQEIEDMLTDPNELAALLNMLLPRLPRLMEEGLKYNEAAAAKVDNYVPIPKWFKQWYEEYITVDFECFTPSEEVYTCYATTVTKYKPSEMWIERGAMINYLKAMIPGLICGKAMRVNGKVVRCYRGIRLTKSIPHAINPVDVEEGDEAVN